MLFGAMSSIVSHMVTNKLFQVQTMLLNDTLAQISRMVLVNETPIIPFCHKFIQYRCLKSVLSAQNFGIRCFHLNNSHHREGYLIIPLKIRMITSVVQKLNDKRMMKL